MLRIPAKGAYFLLKEKVKLSAFCVFKASLKQ